MLGLKSKEKSFLFIEYFFAYWGFCNVCPLYSNRKNLLKTNRTWQFPFSSRFSPCSLALLLTKRPRKSKAPVTRELCPLLAVFPHGPMVSGFLLSTPLPQWAHQYGFSGPTWPQDLCTRCSFHQNSLCPVGLTPTHLSHFISMLFIPKSLT